MASAELNSLTLSDGTYNATLPVADTYARQQLGSKVDKVTGKGLSSNDYTDTEKNKLAGIAPGATANNGTVTRVDVNGGSYTPDSSGVVDLGTINGGGSSGGATTPQELGIGYGTCSTAAGTTAKAATCSGYTLKTCGMVAVKFNYAVPGNSTLNVNNTGAKSIHYNGAAITAGIILAGDTALFSYDGTNYQLLSVDAWGVRIAALETSTPASSGFDISFTEVNGGYGVSASFLSSNPGYKIYFLREGVENISLTVDTHNDCDNYLLLDNTDNENEVRVTLSGMSKDGSAVDRALAFSGGFSVPAGCAMELSYAAFAVNNGSYSYGILTQSSEFQSL